MFKSRSDKKKKSYNRQTVLGSEKSKSTIDGIFSVVRVWRFDDSIIGYSRGIQTFFISRLLWHLTIFWRLPIRVCPEEILKGEGVPNNLLQKSKQAKKKKDIKFFYQLNFRNGKKRKKSTIANTRDASPWSRDAQYEYLWIIVLLARPGNKYY